MESGVLSIIKGSKQQCDSYVGVKAEIIYEWDSKHMRVMDGTTIGGIEIANTSDIIPTVISNIDSIVGMLPIQLSTESIKSSNELTYITAHNDNLSISVSGVPVASITNTSTTFNNEVNSQKFNGIFYGVFKKLNSSTYYNANNEYVVVIDNVDTAIFKNDSIVFNVPIHGVNNTSPSSFVTKSHVDTTFVSKSGSIINGTITYTTYNNGASTPIKTIDWTHSNIQKLAIHIDTELIFNQPANSGSLILKLIMGDSNVNVSFPSNVKWPYDDIPVFDKSQIHIISFMFIDDIYYASVSSGYNI